MIALLQRVSSASVVVEDTAIAQIDSGLLILLGICAKDSTENAKALIHKFLNYRVFSDDDGKMNLSVKDKNAHVLIVSQFTLAANTKKGLRASFSGEQGPMEPTKAKLMYEEVIALTQSMHSKVSCGQFGADMKVHLCNDGPVTFWLES